MASYQPLIHSADARPFAASAVALQAIIVDDEERILLLSSPIRNLDNQWTVVSGALEAGETILDGVLRETREEAGQNVRVRPLGVVHVESFHYDQIVRYMIGIHYLLAYQGGSIQPGDDMAGSEFRWWRLDELSNGEPRFSPSTKLWVLERAIDLYRLWRDERDMPLQPAIEGAL